MNARDLARRVLARVEKGGAWATLALDGELARSGLDDRDRRLAAEIVYGVLRHRTRLDRAIAQYADLGRTPPAVLNALRIAAYQLLFLDRIPAHAAVDDAVGAVRTSVGPKLGGFANAVLRRIAAHGEPSLPDDADERLYVEHSMPRWIVDELRGALGDPAQVTAALAAYAQPASLWARVNVCRATRDDVAAALVAEGATAEPAPEGTSPVALRVAGLGDPAASASFAQGLWTVQDLGAQRIAILAAPRAGQTILDACAGVGGKSTHLAELTAGESPIDAVDLAAQKIKLAAATAERLGHARIRAIAADLLDPAAALQPRYDVVVLDAPCTGLGVLRRHPEAKWRLAPDDVERIAELQAKLLDAVAARVAPGGTLVYSVCTFTRREGPLQAARFLERHPDFSREAELRTSPHEDGSDGFYAVRLRRA
jgi:16S rRNA (cytosine967-C5)-methyltransferase